MEFKFLGMTCLMLIISVYVPLAGAEEINVTLASNLLDINENGNNEIQVSDGYAYTFGTDGLVIFNVKDPSSPVRVGTYVMGASGQIEVSDGYAYGVDYNHTLNVIDINVPSSPILAGSYELSDDPRISVISGIEVSNGFVYIANYTDNIVIIDVSNPSSPTLAGSYATGQEIVDFEVSDNLAYISHAENGFEIVDVSDPSSPNSKGTCDCGYAGPLAISDGYAYALDNSNIDLNIIDINSPSSPSILSTFDMADYLNLVGITVEGDYAYVAEFDDGLDIINISDPLSPTIAGSFGTWTALEVEVSGDYVYLSDAYSSILHIEKSSLIPLEAIFVDEFGSEGTGDGQFQSPSSVAVDSSGNVYVVDTSNNRIQKFDPNGAYITQWESEGTGDGQFDNPDDIAVDSSGNVYVADTYNQRIQKFDSDGNYITQWGSSGTGEGQFSWPSSIAVDSSGNVYVADQSPRIQKFDSNGAYITQWGSSGIGDGEFDLVSGIAVDSSGNVYVADYFNNRIQKFDSDGAYITQWGSFGTGDGQFEGSADGQFNFPGDVAVDSSGNVYVADTSNNRIQKFNSDGTFLTKWGSSGTGDGEFNYPTGVAVDSSGNVYVADMGNNRIQKFALDDINDIDSDVNNSSTTDSDSNEEQDTAESSSSSSSSGGGGGGGTTGEEYENIAYKDVLSVFVLAGSEISYDFDDEESAIEYIRFKALRNWGTISTTIEMLDHRSALVDEDAPDNVYCNVNLWVGNSGFSENIEDSVVGFKVEKVWIDQNDIDVDSIRLCRYADGQWDELDTEKISEDERYLHLEASTPGFSPFAIVGTPIGESAPATTEEDVIQSSNSMVTEDAQLEEITAPTSPNSTFSNRMVIFFVSVLLIGGYVAFAMHKKRE